MFQDSYNGLEEVFSDSPERIENESIGKEENGSVEGAGIGNRLGTQISKEESNEF